MNKSENITNFAVAMAKAQGDIGKAHKDCENPFYHSTYADLSAVADACMSALNENGISVLQPFEMVDNKLELETVFLHESGEWVSSKLILHPDIPLYIKTAYGEPVPAPKDLKPTPQAVGSALTYGRRYMLAAMAGVAPSDDDGNLASGTKEEQRSQSNNKASKEMTCPKCGKAENVRKSKFKEGEFYCFDKAGGCGHKWQPGSSKPDTSKKKTGSTSKPKGNTAPKGNATNPSKGRTGPPKDNTASQNSASAPGNDEKSDPGNDGAKPSARELGQLMIVLRKVCQSPKIDEKYARVAEILGMESLDDFNKLSASQVVDVTKRLTEEYAQSQA